ncbi:hypothetical protein [Streptomyces sp. NPDC002845]
MSGPRGDEAVGVSAPQRGGRLRAAATTSDLGHLPRYDIPVDAPDPVDLLLAEVDLLLAEQEDDDR